MATIKQYQGGTAPLVEDQGDGSHVPLVKVLGQEAGGAQANALTDAQLRASPVPVSAQALTNIDADLGAMDAAAATTDTGTFSLISLVKRGLQNWTTLLSRIPAQVNNRLPVNSSIPTTSSGVILSLTTNATGTTYTAFASQACVALDIVNNTSTTIEYRRGGAGVAMQIPSGTARMVIGVTNANQVDVRRTDTANTAVTLQAEAFTA